jgi:hypothetical protein
MPSRVVPEKEEVDRLHQGEKTTWAAYLPVVLVEEVKRCARVDGYRSASAYVEDLLVFALRTREAVTRWRLP